MLFTVFYSLRLVLLQIQSVSVEFEGLKKSLGASETAKEIDETEKRLKVQRSAVQ